MDEDFLREQICYYQARAAEYDGSILGDENVALGGQLCIIDEPDSSPARPLAADSAADDAWREMRALSYWLRFHIV